MSTRGIVLILLGVLGPGPGTLGAQQSRHATLTVTPSVGLAAITRNGNLESGGLSAFVELGVRTGATLRWSAFFSQRGIGVDCSDGCDLGGQSIGVGVTYPFGRVRAGGGAGFLHRADEWHVQPHGELSLMMGMVRLQVRLEVPQGVDGVSVPFLVGVQLPTG